MSVTEGFSELDANNISYQDFYRDYLVANKPCIFRNYLDGAGWNASKDWTKDGKPDISFFLSNFPRDHPVPISYCNRQYFNSQLCKTETLEEFNEYWNSEREESKYLKDWHFVLDSCRSKSTNLHKYRAYSTPSFFSSDWLNEWLENRGDPEESRTDYKFVYIGPKNSFTPFHTDVFGSFSWSANVAGVKQWTFVCPGDELRLLTGRDCYVTDVYSQESQLLQEKLGEVRKIQVIQNTGDLIFVPSGWYHQVLNLEDTISINHNWFNAANVGAILANLDKELERVEREIDDCKADPDWNNMCQTLLREHHGMNHKDLLDLTLLIIKRRENSETVESVASSSSVEDLNAAQAVVRSLHKQFVDLGLKEEMKLCQEYLEC